MIVYKVYSRFSYDLKSDEMLSNSKNIAVDPTACVDNNCADNCAHPECELCSTCLSEQNLRHLHQAYREHKRRGGFKRLFPSVQHFNNSFTDEMTKNNRIAAKWFTEKCQKEDDWC